jgi:small subunit ribosomal protein S4
MGIKTSEYKRYRQLEICTKPGCRVLDRRPTSPGEHGKRLGTRKFSEYGRQLREKQKVKMIYGVKEAQFRRFFGLASKQKGVTGDNLLSCLERRLDNVLYRLKMCVSRNQAKQMIVHGHILVNDKKVKSPSYLVGIGSVISLSPQSLKQENFLECVVQKRINIAIKVPDWLELQKKDYKGIVLRDPVREDVKDNIEEHLIVELYSK